MTALAARAASLLLRYPDDHVLTAVPLILDALPALPTRIAGSLRPVAAHRAGGEPGALRTEYVDQFDFRRRSSLHLTYYTCGDTRRRGEALAGFAAAFKASGYEVADGELPDYLPAVLDLAAADDTGWRLLRENRVGLDLLAQSLEKSVYRHAVEAVRALLPAATPGDLDAATALARTGPPAEQVGLQPFGSSR
ncbi:nitrate reductase delta subunit [Actinoplanes campanulatus]|uniref:Nitrate reductase delta subunit n=1 Tax=Actinoplanes campanulatus TaxID=113559 RepID=A0A7W5AFQ4_9ACTN|nr:nitrate reductase molybdenum cofactor assembly chaperone [Actinoplanes campanulatus]MBB3095491.1 nitrate reductase delta subunit [Actinoplanes campanulatus]GGN09400.1 nitrate reductase molybdenum cofactor assembly chaperone [Actinoplanes campanulatus]GID36382.1 nitrate reductase molybdenum cofactor assembly chaperone [Actinoplanes campanulatus]